MIYESAHTSNSNEHKQTWLRRWHSPDPDGWDVGLALERDRRVGGNHVVNMFYREAGFGPQQRSQRQPGENIEGKITPHRRAQTGGG